MKPEIEVYGDTNRRFVIDSLKVEMSEGMHDLATCFLANGSTIRPRDIKGLPCRVVWGQGFAAMSMYGYVDTPADVSAEGDSGGFVIMVLGATSVMRSGEARVWNRATPFRVARNIVAPYRLSLVVDKYISTVDQFMQTSDSDWAALTRLADLTGMSLIARDSAVYMVDVRKVIGRALLRPIPSLAEPTNFVRMETPSPIGFDRYEFEGIDGLGSKFAVRGGPDKGVKRHSPKNYSTLEEARLAAVRHQDRERHYIKASASFDTRTSTRAGDVVFVEGDYWYVSKVRHVTEFPTQNQGVTMELHRSERSRPSTSDREVVPPPVLRDGAWVAARKYEVEL